MYVVSHSTKTNASKEVIWNLWKNVDNWTDWDKGLETSKLLDCFEKGGKAKLQPYGGPPVTIQFTSVEENKEFADQADMGPVKICTFHQLEEIGDQIKVTHKTTIEPQGEEGKGLAAKLWPSLYEGIAHSVEELVRIAESQYVS